MKPTQMYNVLIVDDEIFIREGLTKILQNNYPNWNLLGSAASCQEAFAFFKKYTVDLLITDIQMSQKSGLDLIEELREEYPTLEVIIISGYDNFTYARRAMQNKIVHYLLKPLNLDEFRNAMNQVEQSLAQKETSTQHEEIRRVQYTNSIINDLLNGNILENGLLTNILGTELIPYVILCMDMYRDIFSVSQNIASFQTEIHNMLKKQGHLYFSKSLFFFRNKHLWCAILPGNETEQIRNFLKDIHHFLIDIDPTFKIAAGVSTASDSAAHFTDHFRQAYIACRSFPDVSAECFLTQYRRENYADASYYDSTAETRILNQILCGNTAEAQIALHEFTDHLLASSPDIFMIIRAVQRLSYSIMRGLEKSNLLEDHFLELFESMQDLDHVHTKEQLYELLSSCIEHSCHQFQALSTNRQSRIVQYVVQYIESHYGEDLFLDQLAEKVEVSPNYLSTYFKAETNMNVIEYLTYVRLEKAKELLQNSHMKIQQIAEITGYRDPKYFNRIFKKNIGITPKEYRNISNLS